MARRITVCANCIHFVKKGNESYQMFCGASIRERETNPVTGEEMFVGKNKDGEKYFTFGMLHYAKDINKGNCSKFESSCDEADTFSIFNLIPPILRAK